jgi:hypothetical protein
LSAHIERFMRSLKEECLERIIFFGVKSLHAATVSYVDHFLTERNHQGVGNRLLIPGREVGEKAGEVVCRQRLGGLLRYYFRLFRARNRRNYAEFRNMPSKASANSRWPRKIGLSMARIRSQLGIVRGLELHGS